MYIQCSINISLKFTSFFNFHKKCVCVWLLEITQLLHDHWINLLILLLGHVYSDYKIKKNTNLPGQQPPQKPDAVVRLVVPGDGDIDEPQWRVGITERDNRDVDIRSLCDWLVVKRWVRNNQETWLPECSLDLIGEST